MRTIALPRYRAALFVGISVAALGSALPVLAAEAPDAASLEEIVVTASRRETTVQGSPVNIAAVGAPQITQQGFQNLQDIAKWVPGVFIVDQGPRQSSDIVVRGLNASPTSSNDGSNDGGEKVATYLGDIPTYISLRLKDVERVEFLLGRSGFKAGKAAAALRAAADRAIGQPIVRFTEFNEANPTYPVLLGCSTLGGVKLHLEPTAMLPALINRFSSAPFVAAYEAFYDKVRDAAAGRVIGLVFPRKGVRHGMLIYAADDPQVLPLGEREAVFLYAGGDKKDRHWVLVRAFQKAVEAIHNAGHGWTPDGD